MVARGLYDETIVVVMGEFGRTPDINPNLGRDHWPRCWSIAIGGGGLKTGQVVGKSDERAAVVLERETSIGDLFATVYKALGIDWTDEYMTLRRTSRKDRQLLRRHHRRTCHRTYLAFGDRSLRGLRCALVTGW